VHVIHIDGTVLKAFFSFKDSHLALEKLVIYLEKAKNQVGTLKIVYPLAHTRGRGTLKNVRGTKN
jgi:hypothetical protein